MIDRTRRHLAAAGTAVDGPVHAEAADLVARYTHQVAAVGDEIAPHPPRRQSPQPRP